ncbi:hypothetical protein BGZ76_009986 [Entomortierella beljakovae]|nr:hypothetical protein BGZ76_009986 [Entomortierella beljakovae]
MDGLSTITDSLPGALAILGALGCDAMGSVMLSQCINPHSYGAFSRFSQFLDGVCQPMIGPTFKLGSMLTVHTACVLAGRINDWDACAGVIPLREAKAQCYSATEKKWIKQMGSSVYTGVLDHATAVVSGVNIQEKEPQVQTSHHYIKVNITQDSSRLNLEVSFTQKLGASWPLIVVIVLAVMEEWLWGSIVLLGWIGWFFISLSAGSDIKSEHICTSVCSEGSRRRQYLLNDQGVTKSMIDFSVCRRFDDESRREIPKRRVRWRLLRLVGSILMTIHFPIGLVATCYSSSTGALIWILVQFVGLIAGVLWLCREQRLVRQGINYCGGFVIESTNYNCGGFVIERGFCTHRKWGDVLDEHIAKDHWDEVKHQYTS